MFEGSAFTKMAAERDDSGAMGSSECGSGVGGTIIDNNDGWKMFADAIDEVSHRGFLVQTGHDNAARCDPIHGVQVTSKRVKAEANLGI